MPEFWAEKSPIKNKPADPRTPISLNAKVGTADMAAYMSEIPINELKKLISTLKKIKSK